jgi:DNA-binding MarR family transcriptional regulator
MGSLPADLEDRPRYGGLRLKGDLLSSRDIPEGASTVHVILMRLLRLLDREQSDILAQTGDISIPEWRILFLLATKGPMVQRELVNHTVIEQSQASRVMKAMEDAGLVIMKRDKSDRRRWICSLTPTGRERFDKVEPVMRARRDSIDRMFSADELTQFLEFANRIAGRINNMDANNPEAIGADGTATNKEIKT